MDWDCDGAHAPGQLKLQPVKIINRFLFGGCTPISYRLDSVGAQRSSGPHECGAQNNSNSIKTFNNSLTHALNSTILTFKDL